MVNKLYDIDVSTRSRQAMIRCGVERNLNRKWDERQPFPTLEGKTEMFYNRFIGTPVEGAE